MAYPLSSSRLSLRTPRLNCAEASPLSAASRRCLIVVVSISASDRARGNQVRCPSCMAENAATAHVGVVPLQPFAKAEPPACSALEVDPVRPQRAPGGDPVIGGDHHAVDEAGSAEFAARVARRFTARR